MCLFVAPLGIEPRSWVPETHILSIVLRSRWECKDKTFSLFSNKKCRTDPARRSLRCATQFLAAPFRGPAGDNSALAPRRSLERFVVTLGILPEPNPGIASPPLTKVRYSSAVPGGSILKIQKPHAGDASLDFISIGPLKKASFLHDPPEMKYPGGCRGVFVLICSPARNRTWI